MAGIFAFVCKSCGQTHEGSPSFGYEAPWHYSCLSDEEKRTIAELDSDRCKIGYSDQTDYFIRTVLEIPIQGVEEPFTWGVWASLSAKSFNRYLETFNAPIVGEQYFGHLCNRLPFYPDTIGLHTDVIVQGDRSRPTLRLHRGDASGHPLVTDNHEGITVARAQEIAEIATHRSQGNNIAAPTGSVR
jgi:hypothetical protein